MSYLIIIQKSKFSQRFFTFRKNADVIMLIKSIFNKDNNDYYYNISGSHELLKNSNDK